MEKLLKQTTAYKIFSADKACGGLSHAYLISTRDGAKLRDYVKVFVKTALCSAPTYCDDCRTCRLIDKEEYADAAFYPKNLSGKIADKILTADVDEIIASTYLKPLEAPLRVFALCGADTMPAAAQNKLLKTLEEPPENTLILLGALSEYPLLSTVKSRVKKAGNTVVFGRRNI